MRSPRKNRKHSPRKSKDKQNERIKNPLSESYLEDQYELYQKRSSFPLPSQPKEIPKKLSERKPLPDPPQIIKAKEEKNKELSQALVVESFPEFLIKDLRNKFYNVIKERQFLTNVDEKKLNMIKMTIDDLEKNISELHESAKQSKTKDDFLVVLRSIKNLKTFTNRIERNIIDLSFEMDCENRFKSTGKCEDVGACERNNKNCKKISNEKREQKLLRYYTSKN